MNNNYMKEYEFRETISLWGKQLMNSRKSYELREVILIQINMMDAERSCGYIILMSSEDPDAFT